MQYIPVIGLEIHAELLTDSKVFCTCSAEFGGDQNSRCCPVCSGFPGTLPVLNQKAVEYAVKAGFAMNCSINKYSKFDRKNYFYPDLPKAYQISQLDLPLCVGGKVKIETDRGEKWIRINRIHLEEDAGKLVHDDINATSLADYNRCGVPLIEIVTEPDLSSAEEARTFVEQVSLLLQYAGVCDCKMEQGSIRADVNISIMPPDAKEFGTRAEIKNLNSLKSITRAIEYEIKRQAELLDKGEKVVQETRRFNDNHGTTKPMRSKEDAQDYRYFPEPDIQPVNFTDEDLVAIRTSLPKLPDERLMQYTKEYGLSETDAKIIVNDVKLSDFFNDAVAVYPNYKNICNFVLTELLRRLKETESDVIPFSAEHFATLVQMIDEGKVSRNDGKTILRYMLESPAHPEEIAKANGFLVANDMGAVDDVINAVMAERPDLVEQYRAGEKKVFGFLMGQCTSRLKGVANPRDIKAALEKKLS